MWERWKINVCSYQTQANHFWQLKSNKDVFVWTAWWIMQTPIFCPVLQSIGKFHAVGGNSLLPNCSWCECPVQWRENTRSPLGDYLEGPKYCFHEIVNNKIVKCLIYTVNYCYFVCEWDIIYLLYRWSTTVVLFNVSWLQNKHCVHVS